MATALYPRESRDKPHARLYDDDLNHPAWRTLSALAHKVITHLMAQYRPKNPNAFRAGNQYIASLVNTSRSGANRAIKELIDTGHLTLERKGRIMGAKSNRERVVSLTRFPTETRAGDPTYPLKVWEKRNPFNAPDLTHERTKYDPLKNVVDLSPKWDKPL